MTSPNEQTSWGGSPSEAALDLKDPIAEHDPNVGTRWAEPVDESKPRVRVPREIDKFIDQPVWKCPECKFESLTENGKTAHLRPGQDGMTPCERDKKRFMPVKDCVKCGGTGRGSGPCPSCSGSGKGTSLVKCRGCSGKGLVRETSTEKCSVCGGEGTRSYCAGCSGSGEINHCAPCNGSGKISVEAPAQAAALDTDALAAKITEGLSKTLNQGFASVIAALTGDAPKAAPKKKEKPARGSSARVRRGAAAGGSKPLPPLGPPHGAVEDPPAEPSQAE